MTFTTALEINFSTYKSFSYSAVGMWKKSGNLPLLIAALIGAPNFFLYPMLIGSSGMIASIIGVVIVGSKNITDVMKPLNRSFYVSASIAIRFASAQEGRSAIAGGRQSALGINIDI